MKYGIHTELVEEVIHFLSSLHLFHNEKVLNHNSIIVNDYERSQELAWSQDLDEVENIWDDIKSLESGEVIGKLYEGNLNAVERTLREIIQSASNYQEHFVSNYIEIFEEVMVDLHMCALNRLVNGKTDNFYERIFEVYKHGGWPCGWKGEYPEGNMIVYMPEMII
ncbi:cytoplasmic protein [Bacillus pseudomycoides]|uniref:Cytoplasmic protein n=1 Tax=Bacillus pseudomycoides TaxID=64104 RepID=A0A2C3V7N4_9BACI|nr:cytoplasmic protein [Bacillus pseudomycoides]PDY46418.1 cytoplasmic protein [Bacillus pseudomycoides]PEA81173.1 cytoplasmic protein [Bacillus pseudomycoides]PED69651.1 cytoplasmic protein [Bacillus pseudomycoides]PEI43980.1 cytoplasmic protein [Bacillus pseudomycoides]PEJ78319.1 cytoplasmic protein [Bacillus pseudomycoides]